MEQDLRARQFLDHRKMDGGERKRALRESRRAVAESGFGNVTSFLLSKTPASMVRTLILLSEDPLFAVVEDLSFGMVEEPLFGVEEWGRDGLCFTWKKIWEEERSRVERREVEDEGSNDTWERCMRAVGSLCRTSLRELQLGGLAPGLTPRHFNTLFQAMRNLNLQYLRNDSDGCENISSLEAAQAGPHSTSCTLQCLRIGGFSTGELFHATLPPSLLFLHYFSIARTPGRGIRWASAESTPALIGASNSGGCRTSSPSSHEAAWAPVAAPETAEKERAEPAAGHSHTLLSLLCCSSCAPRHLQALSIESSYDDIGSDEEFRDAAGALATYQSLRAISIESPGRTLPEAFCSVLLKRNTTLTTLRIGGYRMPQPGGFDLFFEGLAANQSLTQVNLLTCWGTWTRESILDSLEENATLHDIQLSRTPLEGVPEIEAQLGRNRRNAEIMKKLGVEQRKVQPTSARLFICGEGYAGKTTIAKSMENMSKSCVQKFQDKDWLLYNMIGKVRPRTKGIEVTPLERDGVKVSIWDLAGQVEYRCFHDYVFPDLSNRASPSFFLLVWSPLCPTTKKLKASDTFRKEVKYWLKFITAKTRRSKKFIPSLIIAITRKDMFSYVKMYYEAAIKEMQQSFEGFIRFDINERLFHVDARSPSSLHALTKEIFNMAKNVLQSVKPVLQLVELVHSHFERKITKNKIPPMITKEEYLKECEVELDITESDVAESIALLLNESGDFIYSGSHDLVILNTKWFCHTIMGKLIYYTGPEYATEKHGFFESSLLHKVLEEVHLSTSGRQGFHLCFTKWNSRTTMPKVTGESLLQLLLQLQIVCKEEGSSRILMPSSFQPDSSLRERHPFQQGRRLSSQESKLTFLTPGVFPNLQVQFYKKFPKRVELHKNYIYIKHETGVRVEIEFFDDIDSDENYIDIIVQSPKSGASKLEWVKEHVIMDIIKSCANKGVQGVILEQAAIHQCGYPTPRRHVVLVQKLLDQLEEELKRRKIHASSNSVEEAIYSWASDYDDEGAKITELLTEVEVEEVCRRFSNNLDDAMRVMNEGLVCFSKEINTDEENYEFEESDKYGKLLKAVYDSLKQVHFKLDEIQKSIFEIRDNLFNKLIGMEKMIKQLAKREVLPSMWVFTIDNGRRVITRVVPGLHKAQLQFLCEQKTHPHLPEGEPEGISFSFVEEESLLQKALPYMKFFLKYTYVAVKISAHLMSGGGSLIPDFSQVVDLVDDWSFSPPSLPRSETSSNLPLGRPQSSNRMKFQEEAQTSVWNLLQRRKCANNEEIYNHFKLRRVRYKDDQHICWLCDKHFKEELNSKVEYFPLHERL